MLLGPCECCECLRTPYEWSDCAIDCSCNCVSLSLVLQPPDSTHRVKLIMPRGVRRASILMNFLRMLQMSCERYKYIVMIKNGLRILTSMLRKSEEYAFLANVRSILLIFATINELWRGVKNIYECLAIISRSFRLIGECYSQVQSQGIRECVRAALDSYFFCIK